MSDRSSDADRLRDQVADLERENAQLRARLGDGSALGSPTFNPIAFRRALNYYIRLSLVVVLPLQLLPVAWVLRYGPAFTSPMLGPIPLIDFAGMQSNVLPGIGFGVFAFGGLAIGAVAVGGGAIGLIAMGGGAVGLFSFGGGSLGLIAVGGGAVGLVSLGGGAAGIWACGERGAGRHVLSFKRQDAAAVEFFCRWMPRLRSAVTRPQPVVRIESPRL
jgi:hypothetical protein